MASRLERATRASVEILREEKASFALIGGIALGLRSAPRATQDVDLAVAVDDAAAERLIYAFQGSGFRIDAVLVNKRDRSLATVRVDHRPTKILVDLLISFCGIEREVVRAASIERWGGLTIPVATRGHLIAMKLLANRKQDQADLENLLRDLPANEKLLALKAVGQIMNAGLGDGRNLVRELKTLVRTPRPSVPQGFELRLPRPPRRR